MTNLALSILALIAVASNTSKNGAFTGRELRPRPTASNPPAGYGLSQGVALAIQKYF
jgi:hypothetical protein